MKMSLIFRNPRTSIFKIAVFLLILAFDGGLAA